MHLAQVQVVPEWVNLYASCGCLQASDILYLGFNLINLMVAVIAGLFAIFMIIAAIRYFTAYGSEEQATKAKSSIITNLVALIIALTVFVVLRFITSEKVFDFSTSGVGHFVDYIWSRPQPPPVDPTSCKTICAGRYYDPKSTTPTP